MQTHDYMGLSFFKNPAYVDEKFEGMELKLGLSLPGLSVEVDSDDGMNLKEECARGKEIRSDCRLRSKRVYSQAFGCGEERERSLLSLQICGGCYYQEVQSNSENEQADESSTSPISNSGEVGWPPVGSFRKNIITALHSSFDNEIKSVVEAESPCLLLGTPKFVKVIMDGIPIGRKVDLSALNSYKTLALAIQDMFQLPKICVNGVKKHRVDSNTKHLCLLDDSSNYILTYIDNDGDWMLVGDAPWGTFVNSVRRLRVAKRSQRVVSICNPMKRV